MKEEEKKFMVTIINGLINFIIDVSEEIEADGYVVTQELIIEKLKEARDNVANQ